MDWYSHLEKPIDLWRRRIDDDDQVDEFIRNWGVREDRNGGRWIKHYCSSHRILLVGEGNFSFSACLAKAFGLAYNMVSTSLDSLGFLSENYKDALSNILLLLSRGCNVIHGVDATTAAHHYALIGMRFDRIVFNFPLAVFDKSLPRSEEIKRNQKLLLYFFANAKEMLSYAGEIHVVHKTNGFFKEWEIEKLAFQSGLHLMEQSDFNLNDYPGYKNKYGYGETRTLIGDQARLINLVSEDQTGDLLVWETTTLHCGLMCRPMMKLMIPMILRHLLCTEQDVVIALGVLHIDFLQSSSIKCVEL